MEIDYTPPQEYIDLALSTENTVLESEREIYLEFLNNRTLSERLANRVDNDGQDLRQACILIGLFRGWRERRDNDYKNS